jgi:hypothetical protein
MGQLQGLSRLFFHRCRAALDLRRTAALRRAIATAVAALMRHNRDFAIASLAMS